MITRSISIFTISILLLSHSTITNYFPTPPPIPILPLPTSQQLSWQLSEMTLFLHFGTNTFTDTEWGTGDADPSVFNPAALNATQWVAVAKENGFSRVILTAKHHDGFCLWPSNYTDYSVKSSPFRGGNGDVVGELAKAAEEAEIQLGLYLSPWDRHESVVSSGQRHWRSGGGAGLFPVKPWFCGELQTLQIGEEVRYVLIGFMKGREWRWFR